jgi:hypothetical protein
MFFHDVNSQVQVTKTWPWALKGCYLSNQIDTLTTLGSYTSCYALKKLVSCKNRLKKSMHYDPWYLYGLDFTTVYIAWMTNAWTQATKKMQHVHKFLMCDKICIWWNYMFRELGISIMKKPFNQCWARIRFGWLELLFSILVTLSWIEI